MIFDRLFVMLLGQDDDIVKVLTDCKPLTDDLKILKCAKCSSHSEQSKPQIYFRQVETYKLPHRLIEKKRRDRINECIAQLKDLLPEHLKLTTLGHLEKAVVLELTLKHLKALTALTEQQHQKIIALQNGERSLKSPLQSDLEAFHSGFQTCTKEVLQYLSRWESWTPREQSGAQLLRHLHSVCSRFLPGGPLLAPRGLQGNSPPPDPTGTKPEGQQPHCVPVIQRTQNPSSSSTAAQTHHPQQAHSLSSSTELGGENDTDTDSGYGGESEGRLDGDRSQGKAGLAIKQEPPGEEVPPGPKKRKLDRAAAEQAALSRPDPALLGSLMALGGGSGSGPSFGQPPFCLPFYFISPSYVQPFLDKNHLEKYFYPAAAAATPLPLLYPGIPAQAAAAAAAAAAAFPCLSSVLAEKAPSALLSPERAASSPAQPLLLPPFAASCNVEADLPPQEQPLEEKPAETLPRQQGTQEKTH
ncbi:hypothetical protein JD844_027538 [Phrynosoma platyrhinos]|uniref:Basic helix-loop-helix family member e41 n=1 Tax=Phrynosoma platyrhinos TaxID=52577 RepID=A0ABQ7SGH9_PHRPL|nr:hypothetical protein JD844_027538 [Phrynosoma platyrhinos]